jgi:IS30 family transposase
MEIKKVTPSRNMSKWTKQDRKTLKVMTKEKKTIKEISDALGRTPAAVIYQKSQMGLTKPKKIKVEVKIPKVKTSKGKEVKIPTGVSNMETPQTITREQAKDMSSAARQIARANGKRITMAMFFVEDL